MKIDEAVAKLRNGIDASCADDITEVLCNLGDGTCDTIELIPLLEAVAGKEFYYFDDNGAGGMPHATGDSHSFDEWVERAISNIRQNQKLTTRSPIGKRLKSLDTEDIAAALRELAAGNSADETLIPILEKIATKDKYDSYSYTNGFELAPVHLGDMARAALQRINGNLATACKLCSSIPQTAVANTGREEFFDWPVTSLNVSRTIASAICSNVPSAARCSRGARKHRGPGPAMMTERS